MRKRHITLRQTFVNIYTDVFGSGFVVWRYISLVFKPIFLQKINNFGAIWAGFILMLRFCCEDANGMKYCLAKAFNPRLASWVAVVSSGTAWNLLPEPFFNNSKLLNRVYSSILGWNQRTRLGIWMSWKFAQLCSTLTKSHANVHWAIPAGSKHGQTRKVGKIATMPLVLKVFAQYTPHYCSSMTTFLNVTVF